MFLLLCMLLSITTSRQALFEKRLQEARQKAAEKNRSGGNSYSRAQSDETTLVAPILSDQLTDCSVSNSTFKYWISLLGTSTEG